MSERTHILSNVTLHAEKAAAPLRRVLVALSPSAPSSSVLYQSPCPIFLSFSHHLFLSVHLILHHCRTQDASHPHWRDRPGGLWCAPLHDIYPNHHQSLSPQQKTRRTSRRPRESQGHNPQRLHYVPKRTISTVKRCRWSCLGTGSQFYESWERVSPWPLRTEMDG